jgi:hypothetical protein
MKTLELKHLAPYLPYGLNFKTDFDHIFYRMSGLEINKSIVVLKAKNNAKNTKRLLLKKLINSKPILRPLSDLTKEIQVNGEKFVPKEWLRLNYISENIGLNTAVWSYRTIEKLLEWHFDVFGLIDKGLAVGINTLEK